MKLFIFFLYVFSQVSVFGFGVDGDGNWSHYFEKFRFKGLGTGLHSGKREYNTYEHLHEAKKIKFFKKLWIFICFECIQKKKRHASKFTLTWCKAFPFLDVSCVDIDPFKVNLIKEMCTHSGNWSGVWIHLLNQKHKQHKNVVHRCRNNSIYGVNFYWVLTVKILVFWR